jgi:hypothetical protein
VVQKVLSEVDAPDLRVFVVWEPILATDDEATAPPATVLIPDPRAVHFWAPELDLARAFGEHIGLAGEPAWDAYLLYDRTARWRSVAPPAPAAFQHQLYGLPDERRLDGNALAARLRELLAQSGT